MIPVNPDCPPDLSILTQNNASPGVNDLVTEKHVPLLSARSTPTQNDSSSGLCRSAGQCYRAFPALAKGSSLPASLLNLSEEKSRTRKRDSSGEEEEQNSSKQAKVTRQEANCSVIKRQANDRFGFKATECLKRSSSVFFIKTKISQTVALKLNFL